MKWLIRIGFALLVLLGLSISLGWFGLGYRESRPSPTSEPTSTAPKLPQEKAIEIASQCLVSMGNKLESFRKPYGNFESEAGDIWFIMFDSATGGADETVIISVDEDGECALAEDQ